MQLFEKTYQQTAKAAMRIAQEEALYNHQHSLTIRKQR
ncbi:hypothetical protein [Staphylococcus chromogenes]